MNVHARDAILGLGICAVVITALVVSHSLAVLWLLALLLLVVFG